MKFALCFITLAVVVGKLMDTKSVLECIEQNIKEVLWGKILSRAGLKVIFGFSQPDSDASAILFDPSHTDQPLLNISSKDLYSNL